MDIPRVGSMWRHRNGTPYRVLHIANELDDKRYPLMIVYRGPDRKVWARRANDWCQSVVAEVLDDEG